LHAKHIGISTSAVAPGGPALSAIGEFLPTEDVLDCWFEALCDCRFTYAAHARETDPEAEKAEKGRVTLIMQDRPVPPSTSPAAAPNVLTSALTSVPFAHSPPHTRQPRHIARSLLWALAAIAVLITVGYTSSRLWLDSGRTARWSVR
jgi:hypothetical protein